MSLVNQPLGLVCCFAELLALAIALPAGNALAAPSISVPRTAITAAELGVVIAKGDAVSEAIGAYYQSARGIPAANVVRVLIPTGANDISPSQLALIKAQVDAALPATVQATLLTWTKPYRVQGSCGMSITSALALGYDSKFCSQEPTSIPYFDSDSTTPWNDFGIRPSMMLGASTVDAAVKLINRGVQADLTYPRGNGYLIRTTDSARSGPRWSDFASLPTLWSFPSGLTLNYVDNSSGGVGSDVVQHRSPVLFYFTGLTTVPGLATNSFLPGAVGDHLTSFGGDLAAGTGQMPATEWLEAGATGSYGTVMEPYAYADKFPRASVMIDHYYRGATLIEAYWKSVRAPGQGLFLGEPLARPFADQPTLTVDSDGFVVNTRAMRAGYRYAIESRSEPQSDWTALGYFWPSRPGPQDLRSKANGDSQLRLSGPCPDVRAGDQQQAVSATTLSSRFEAAQGGRTQRVYFQLRLRNEAPAASGCTQEVKLAAEPSNAAVMTSFVSYSLWAPPDTYFLRPQESAIATLVVTFPEAAAATTDESYNVAVKMTDIRANLQSHVDTLRINLTSGTSTDEELAPMLRISRPTFKWLWTPFPRWSATATSLRVNSDVKPGSGIVRVVYQLQAPQDQEDVPPFEVSSVSTNKSTSYGAALIMPNVTSGTYHLIATGYSASGAAIATAERYVYADFQSNRITGTAASEVLTGTAGNDVIWGMGGVDTLTGGAGSNVFVIDKPVAVGQPVTTITDFKPGRDSIDMRAVLVVMQGGLGIDTTNPYARGLVQLIDTPDGVEVRVPYSGLNAPLQTLVRLLGLKASMINAVRDLQLQ